jgi:HYR domain/CARDB
MQISKTLFYICTMRPIYTLLFTALLQLMAVISLYAQSDLTIAVPNPIYDNTYWNNILTFTFDIHNQGTGNAVGSFKIRSALSVDDIWSPDDVLDGVVTTGNLLAGQKVTDVLGAMTVPVVPEGYYYILLKIDADDEILESDEFNNTINAGRINVENPDKPNLALAINFAGLSNVNSLNLAIQVSNFTAFSVTDSSELQIIQSSNGQKITSFKVPPIAAGGYFSLNPTILLAPTDLISSPFSFYALIDPQDSINEIDENDNYANYELSFPTGQNLPDYELTLNAPISLSNESITINYAVRNAGGGITPESTVSFALRSDSSYYWFPRYPLGFPSFSALNAGQTLNNTYTVQLPTFMNEGHYYLEIIAGSDANNTNNQMLIPFDIQANYTNPEHILLGEGNAKALRQNADQSYTVLLKTLDGKAKAVRVSAQGDILNTTLIGPWGEQTTFANDSAFITVLNAYPNIQLVKTNTQGVQLWSKSFPIQNQEFASCVSATNDGGYIIGGAMYIPNPNGPNSYLPFLLRTDDIGNEIWRRTTGPAAAQITQIVNLTDSTFGAVANYYSYFDQKFGFEIFKISADGLQFTSIDQITNFYQGTFYMDVASIKAGQNGSVYYASNHVIAFKWSNEQNSYYAKSDTWKIAKTSCSGVCGIQGNNTAYVTVPTSDGGGLAAGTTSTPYSEYNLTRVDAQGTALWSQPFPKGVTDGVQNVAGGFALCGVWNSASYLTLIDGAGNPTDGGVCQSDTEPPVLVNCPANFTVETVGTSEYVSWTPPNAFDNCGTATVSANTDQGNLGLGNTEVIFTATDLKGNTATCSLVVSLVAVPCLVGNYFAACNDNATPDVTTDDVIIFFIHLNSPDQTTWQGTFEGMPNFPVISGAFNTTSEFHFALSEVSPFLLDGLLSIQIKGESGNTCDKTIDFVFNPSDYCVQLSALTDLEVTHLNLPTNSVPAGSTCPFYFDLYNRSDKSITAPLDIHFYLSKDSLPSPDDWMEQINLSAGLPAGDSILAFVGNLHVPTNMTLGNYYLIVAADPDGVWAELDETNNTAIGNLAITAGSSGSDDLSQSSTANYQVHPNPFNQYFRVSCPPHALDAPVELKLMNSTGVQVFHAAMIGKPNLEIQPGALPAGVYYLEVRDSDGVVTRQLVKVLGN